ncbi:MAG: outer membrane lipoprotein SlyB [Gammaproteobacteria bacterium]|jgi:outer membrane lipoprotein SlyB
MRSKISLSKHFISLFLSLLFLSGCMGKNYRPVVDPKGVDMRHYELDLIECQAIADQQSILAESAQTAVVGAAAGAVVGTVIGAIFGDAGAGAASGAGYGGAGGAVDGAIGGLKGQSQIIANCMAGRSYKVLR